MPPSIERRSEGVTRIEHRSDHALQSQRYLYCADVHFDSKHCDRAMFKRHLEEAKADDTLVFCFGDFFDAMQSRTDKRGSKSAVLPEHQTSRYWNALIEEAADWLEPYAKNIAVLSDGNHETAIRKHLEIDILDLLVNLLNARTGSTIQHMPYSGYIHHYYCNPQGGGGRNIQTFYHHGHGGGGVVTKGVLGTARKGAYVRGCDLIVQGHIHESWTLETMEQEARPSGKIVTRTVLHVCLPTYKSEDLHGGWHVETGKPPKPTGAWWIHHDRASSFEIRTSARRAL